MAVNCKSCGRKFLAPAVDTNRQEVSAGIDVVGGGGGSNGDGGSGGAPAGGGFGFGLICPFCMTHAFYSAQDLLGD